MTSRISASFRVLIDDSNFDDCCSEDYDFDPFFQDVTTYEFEEIHDADNGIDGEP